MTTSTPFTPVPEPGSVSTTAQPSGAPPVAAPSTPATAASGGHTLALHRVAGVLRISLGFIFLWAFLDKAFALGFDTGKNPKTGVVSRFGDAAWIHGGSPTKGFLGNATAGPLADVYGSFAGATWADWAFMIGLLGIGAALVLGIGMRIATVAGVAMLVLMWSAVLPPANNPFMDDHLVYALTLVVLLLLGAGHTYGLGRRYEQLPVVAHHAWLR